MSQYTELIGYIISGILTVVNVVKSRKLKRKEKENAELKSDLYGTKLQKLKELYDFQRFSVLEHEINNLFISTPITRFTIMFAVNGKMDFNFMSVVYDQHKTRMDVGLESAYDKIEIDEKYMRLLKHTEMAGFVWQSKPFDIGKISAFVDMEGVRSCGWGHIIREELDAKDDLLVFFSLSSEQDMTILEKAKSELIIKGVLPEIVEILKVPR